MLELVGAERVAAISALLTEFCWCADNAEGERIGSLFTEDGCITTPHFEVRGRDSLGGRAANEARISARQDWMNLQYRAHGLRRRRPNSMSSALVSSSKLLLQPPQHMVL
jgi:SnoaL-like domain